MENFKLMLSYWYVQNSKYIEKWVQIGSNVQNSDGFFTSFEETLTHELNDFYTLNFKIPVSITDDTNTRQISPLLHLFFVGSKLKLELETDDIEFVITSITPNTGPDATVYEINAQDAVSFGWSKRFAGYSYCTLEGNMLTPKNIVNIAEEVLNETINFNTNPTAQWIVTSTIDPDITKINFILDQSETTPYGVLLEACNTINAYMKVNFRKRTLDFYRKDKSPFSGFFIPKERSVLCPGTTDGDRLTTVLHVQGGQGEDDLDIDIVPAIPKCLYPMMEEFIKHVEDNPSTNFLDVLHSIVIPKDATKQSQTNLNKIYREQFDKNTEYTLYGSLLSELLFPIEYTLIDTIKTYGFSFPFDTFWCDDAQLSGKIINSIETEDIIKNLYTFKGNPNESISTPNNWFNRGYNFYTGLSLSQPDSKDSTDSCTLYGILTKTSEEDSENTNINNYWRFSIKNDQIHNDHALMTNDGNLLRIRKHSTLPYFIIIVPHYNLYNDWSFVPQASDEGPEEIGYINLLFTEDKFKQAYQEFYTEQAQQIADFIATIELNHTMTTTLYDLSYFVHLNNITSTDVNNSLDELLAQFNLQLQQTQAQLLYLQSKYQTYKIQLNNARNRIKDWLQNVYSPKCLGVSTTSEINEIQSEYQNILTSWFETEYLPAMYGIGESTEDELNSEDSKLIDDFAKNYTKDLQKQIEALTLSMQALNEEEKNTLQEDLNMLYGFLYGYQTKIQADNLQFNIPYIKYQGNLTDDGVNINATVQWIENKIYNKELPTNDSTYSYSATYSVTGGSPDELSQSPLLFDTTSNSGDFSDEGFLKPISCTLQAASKTDGKTTVLDQISSTDDDNQTILTISDSNTDIQSVELENAICSFQLGKIWETNFGSTYNASLDVKVDPNVVDFVLISATDWKHVEWENMGKQSYILKHAFWSKNHAEGGLTIQGSRDEGGTKFNRIYIDAVSLPKNNIKDYSPTIYTAVIDFRCGFLPSGAGFDCWLYENSEHELINSYDWHSLKYHSSRRYVARYIKESDVDRSYQERLLPNAYINMSYTSSPYDKVWQMDLNKTNHYGRDFKAEINDQWNSDPDSVFHALFYNQNLLCVSDTDIDFNTDFSGTSDESICFGYIKINKDTKCGFFIDIYLSKNYSILFPTQHMTFTRTVNNDDESNSIEDVRPIYNLLPDAGYEKIFNSHAEIITEIENSSINTTTLSIGNLKTTIDNLTDDASGLYRKFYTNFEPFIYENTYSNSDEIDKIGLLEQAWLYLKTNNKPQINISSVDVIFENELLKSANYIKQPGYTMKIFNEYNFKSIPFIHLIEQLNANTNANNISSIQNSIIAKYEALCSDDEISTITDPQDKYIYIYNKIFYIDSIISNVSYKLREPSSASFTLEEPPIYKDILSKMIKSTG